MFKTDKSSLEKLSFALNERDISNFKKVLEYLQSTHLLTMPKKDVKRVLDGLDAIGKLKLNKRIYGFHVNDSYADGRRGAEGVELYLRQGDELEAYFQSGDRDDVFDVGRAVEYLKENKISTIYTGQIPHKSSFLGLPHECDKEDPVTRDILDESEISDFESSGIKVITLESLI